MFKKHHEERKMKFKDKFDVQLFLWIGLACFNLPEQKIWNFELENLRTSFNSLEDSPKQRATKC